MKTMTNQMPIIHARLYSWYLLCRMFKHCERTEEGLQSKTMTATAFEETFDTLD